MRYIVVYDGRNIVLNVVLYLHCVRLEFYSRLLCTNEKGSSIFLNVERWTDNNIPYRLMKKMWNINVCVCFFFSGWCGNCICVHTTYMLITSVSVSRRLSAVCNKLFVSRTLLNLNWTFGKDFIFFCGIYS